MPLVLATGGDTASGYKYDDVLGVQYEFPALYLKLMQPGEKFVYYQGSRASESGTPSYFGTGVLGISRHSPRAERYLIDLAEVYLFDEAIPAKAADGIYLETGTSRGTNWANGVRSISDQVFARILTASVA